MLTTSSRSLFRPSSASAVSSRYLRNISSPGLLAASSPSTSTATSTFTTTRTTLAPQSLIPNRRSFSTSPSFQFIQSPVKMVVTDIKTGDDFKSSVTATTSSSLILIDCYATWCGPCRSISPVVEKFSDEYSNVTFYKVDVDEVPDVAQELGVRAMPTFYFFKNGNKVDEVVGASPQAIKNAIEKNK